MCSVRGCGNEPEVGIRLDPPIDAWQRYREDFVCRPHHDQMATTAWAVLDNEIVLGEDLVAEDLFIGAAMDVLQSSEFIVGGSLEDWIRLTFTGRVLGDEATAVRAVLLPRSAAINFARLLTDALALDED